MHSTLGPAARAALSRPARLRGASGQARLELTAACGRAADSVAHFLRPLRPWLQSVWRALRWPEPTPAEDQRSFALFAAYRWTPRRADEIAFVVLHGAVLAACRAARYHLTQTSLALPANRIVRAAQTQMEHHIRLDWHCATSTDCLPDDLRVSVRPTSRLAFFERWGCLCQFAHGALEFDARICP